MVLVFNRTSRDQKVFSALLLLNQPTNKPLLLLEEHLFPPSTPLNWSWLVVLI